MPVIDRLRRRGTLAATGLLLAAPLLASCGFDYPTDRVNTIAPGVNDRSGDIKVLGAVVIADRDGSGVFAATMANSGSETAALDELGGENGDLSLAGELPDAEIPPGSRVSLIQEGGIPVTGGFKAGDFVPVTLTFDTGQTTTLDVNVVRACYQYSTDKLGDLNFPDPSSSADTGTASEPSGTSPEAGTYDCAVTESEVWGDGEEPHHGGEG